MNILCKQDYENDVQVLYFSGKKTVKMFYVELILTLLKLNIET